MVLGDDWRVSIVYDAQRDRDVMKIRRRVDSMHGEYLCADGNVVRTEVGDLLPDEALWPLPEDALPSLMDSLWDRGIRPSDRRYEEEAKLLREQLDHCRGLLAQVLPRALRKEA
jgi:hypothetical protein